MKLSFLDPLYARPGPCASAYLDTSRDIDDPDHAIELRWRHLRDALTAQGADPETVAALSGAVGADREVPGRHGQALFAARGRLLLAEVVPEPPVREAARYAAMPDAMRMAVQHAPDIPFATVLVRRLGPREGADDAEAPMEAYLETGRWPMSRVAPGPRAHWRGVASHWRGRAEEIAEELATLAAQGTAEVVAVCAGVWERGVLVNRLPSHLRERVATLPPPADADADADTEGSPDGPDGRALLEEELGALLGRRLSAGDQARRELFLARRARDEAAGEGLRTVVAALQRGQAEALLLNRPTDLPMPLWAGPEPKQLALSPDELRSFGVRSFYEEPADAIVLRALVGTGAELVVVPREELPLDDGVGVLLRY
ncbi:baeRF2 domain-containing protein [Allostreptomyces psammosilenae]|uniref:Uncharacterized protein n=1 Tax=Allostreptomyces psammosilenae TaxID=1892865 RepID=A0A852ZWP8_9ACTN|nr:hypothetical protein [Allostreptomyces psammosilenae]NYI06405.1 hypothetical protein [Allostreptomyces psammosilenae]